MEVRYFLGTFLGKFFGRGLHLISVIYLYLQDVVVLYGVMAHVLVLKFDMSTFIDRSNTKGTETHIIHSDSVSKDLSFRRFKITNVIDRMPFAFSPESRQRVRRRGAGDDLGLRRSIDSRRTA